MRERPLTILITGAGSGLGLGLARLFDAAMEAAGDRSGQLAQCLWCGFAGVVAPRSNADAPLAVPAG